MFLFLLMAYFLPPAQWEIAQLKNPSPYVQVGFIGKGASQFRPSINLAIEEVDIPLKEYVKAVKEIQTAEPNAKWRNLGKICSPCGEGCLVEIATPSAWGEVKTLQAFFIRDQKAYILTAALTREDLPLFQKEILASFRSLQIIPDLSAPIANPEERDAFTKFFRSLGEKDPETEWKALQKQVVEKHSELGAYWQFLALKEGRSKIFPSNK